MYTGYDINKLNIEKKLEGERMSFWIKSCLTIITIFSIVLIIFFSKMGNSEHKMYYFIYVFGTCGALSAGLIYLFFKKYKKIYKNSLVRAVLEEKFENVFFDAENGFDKHSVAKMQIVKLGNEFETEDFISATYKGVNFKRSDVVIRNKTSNGNNSNTVTYFKGRIYVVDFNKQIDSVFQVKSKSFNYSLKPEFVSEKDKVMMESELFNSKFQVYARNGENAFYVLTPKVIERLLYLFKNSKSVCMNIGGNKMVIALNSNYNSLEPTIFTKVNYLLEKSRLLAELGEITNIIDILELYPNEYKKMMQQQNKIAEINNNSYSGNIG